MNYKNIKKKFLKDVENHKMSIIKDDGVYRHIIFQEPDTSIHKFELITWPMNLCICGDMGTYVFSRTNDMFNFFYTHEYDFDYEYIINPSYWEEKLNSESIFGKPLKKFDKNLFIETVTEMVEEYYELYEDKKEECLKELKLEVFNYIDDVHEQVIYDKLFNFRYEDIDFYDIPSIEDYSYHYIWICYAIVWGISKYKENKKEE